MSSDTKFISFSTITTLHCRSNINIYYYTCKCQKIALWYGYGLTKLHTKTSLYVKIIVAEVCNWSYHASYKSSGFNRCQNSDANCSNLTLLQSTWNPSCNILIQINKISRNSKIQHNTVSWNHSFVSKYIILDSSLWPECLTLLQWLIHSDCNKRYAK
jgi:hypothetical protein